jgi:hypothetical protein
MPIAHAGTRCKAREDNRVIRRSPELPDFAMYVRALAVYARNLGVLLPPLVAAAVGVGLDYLGSWLFAAIGGALMGIIQLAVFIILGYGFALAVIFADDAWRHGRGSLRSAWDGAARRAGDILLTIVGFLFLIYVAGLIGDLIPVPYFSYVLKAVALWAFIYAIPAAAIGGVPSGGSFSVSLQSAKRHPAATALLVVVSYLVWIGLTDKGFAAIAIYLHSFGAYYVAQLLLQAIALGYIALVVAKQYADFAFRPYW